KPGAVASVDDFHLTLHAIEVAYSSAQGYIAAKVDAPPQLDRAAHLVSYSFSVDPGPQYHVKSIQWSGLPPDQQQALASQFRMKPGDIYDATYFVNFVRQHADLLRQGYRPGTNIRANPADLTLVFSKGPTPPPPRQEARALVILTLSAALRVVILTLSEAEGKESPHLSLPAGAPS